MNLSKPLSSLVLAGLLSSGLVACGGGGGGGGGGNDNPSNPPADPPPTTRQISGTAESVGNSVAMFESRGLLYAVGNFFLPAAGAAITGLQPVQGATVELIRIDNDGKQVGDVLASTVTSITGAYQLTLPAGLDFSANLVVRITGNSGDTLDSQVVSETVNINPLTDFLLDRLIANGTNLAELPTNEVVKLRGQVEEFDLTAGADLSEMLEQLNTTVGAFLDTNIEIVKNGAGQGSAVAGSYHYVEFGLELDDSDDIATGPNSVNRIGGDIIFGSLNVSDAGGGNVNITAPNVLDTHFNLLYMGGGNNYLWSQHHVEEEESFPATVDGSGALVIRGEFEEEVEPDWYGYRWPASTLRIAPMADTGMMMGRIDEVAVRYELDANSALDPNRKHGDEIYYGLLIAAKKSQGLSNASLNGAYGGVDLSVAAAHGSGRTEMDAYSGVFNFNGNGAVTGVSSHDIGVSRMPNQAPTWGSNTVPGSGNYSVASDGSLTLGSNSGFVGNGGQLLVAVGREVEQTAEQPPVLSEVRHSLEVMVKLPASQPSLSGQTYEFRNLRLGYRNSATVLTVIDGGEVTFNEGGTMTLRVKAVRGVSRGNDGANLNPISQGASVVADNQPVTIGSNGSIDVSAVTLGDGSSLQMNGYVSEDGKVLVMRVAQIKEPGAIDLGIVVGSLKQ